MAKLDIIKRERKTQNNVVCLRAHFANIYKIRQKDKISHKESLWILLRHSAVGNISKSTLLLLQKYQSHTVRNTAWENLMECVCDIIEACCRWQ